MFSVCIFIDYWESKIKARQNSSRTRSNAILILFRQIKNKRRYLRHQRPTHLPSDLRIANKAHAYKKYISKKKCSDPNPNPTRVESPSQSQSSSSSFLFLISWSASWQMESITLQIYHQLLCYLARRTRRLSWSAISHNQSTFICIWKLQMRERGVFCYRHKQSRTSTDIDCALLEQEETTMYRNTGYHGEDCKA